jgi:PAS domain S-box-containing protein
MATAPRVAPSERAELERVEDFFVNASVGFHMADADGTVTSGNRALALLLGVDGPAACEGLGVSQLLSDPAVGEEALARVAAGEVVTNLDAAVRRAGGASRRVSLNVSGRFDAGELVATRWVTRPRLEAAIPAVDPDGQAFVDPPPGSDAAQWVAPLADEIDVAERIDAMTDTQRRARLVELEDFFDNAPAAIHCVALNGDVIKANRTDLANVGYLDVPDEYLGRHIAQVYADRALLDDLLVRLSAGTPIVNVRSRLRRRDGSLFPVIVFSSGRVRDGSFENTRCVVFEDADPPAEPGTLREFSWPPTG